MIPSSAFLQARLEAARAVLDSEPERIRPADSRSRPGGLLLLQELPTILVPDLHARGSFLSSILDWRPPDPASRCASTQASTQALSPTVRALLRERKINLVCLGDGINTEGTAVAAQRWYAALEEYLTHWKTHRSMDEEMSLALGAMLFVMELKIAYPENFHFLKGNHDNIADRTDHGDRHFYKYASESAMGASWFLKTYGPDFLESWREFELSLPILAFRPDLKNSGSVPTKTETSASRRPSQTAFVTPSLASALIASHAEPAFPLSRDDIIECRDRADAVYALTWTDNDASIHDSVSGTMKNLGIAIPDNSHWFTGHRSISERVHFRAGGLLAQIHNAHENQFVYIEQGNPFDSDRDIIRLDGILPSALTLGLSDV